jgi:phosphate transport system permease protein
MNVSPMRYARRRGMNKLVMALAWAAALSGLLVLAVILATLVVEGVSGINLRVFTMSTPVAGSPGGLLNAIYGSVVMTILGTALGTPVGILAGTYLAEYGRGTRLALVVRFINDILLSAPSIVIGVFINVVVVYRMHHFSAWAGGFALAFLVLPVVVRTTEDMLLLVPNSLREAASAIGSPRWVVILQIAYRAARTGMITGVLLAVARITGETAPLLFTALNNQFWSTNMGAPMANLPVVIYNFANSPYPDLQKLAWTAALLITFTVLAINIGARALSTSRSKES